MRVGSLAAAAACVCAMAFASLSPSLADGMPDDDNFNPVPSVPAVPAPGVTPPAPVRSKPKPAAVNPPEPPAPVVEPAPAPSPAPEPLAAPEPPMTPPPAVVPEAPAAPAVTTPSTVIVPPSSAPAAAPAPLAAPPQPAEPTRAPTQTNGLQTVYEVLSVDITMLKKTPAAAVITVRGTARTAGWTKIELRPLSTGMTETGMRSFTLMGQPPSGFSSQVLTTVSAKVTLDPLPDGVRTIRVLSETNEIAQSFP